MKGLRLDIGSTRGDRWYSNSDAGAGAGGVLRTGLPTVELKFWTDSRQEAVLVSVDMATSKAS